MVRRACIDIGSNTTRLLVAERNGPLLRQVHQEREFTHIGGDGGAQGTISAEKIGQVAEAVAAQVRTAHDLGSVEVYGVATAAIRGARNGDALVAAIRDASGLDVQVLSAEEEARLAFVGAARTLGHVPEGVLGVVDVGGGSSELVVGTAPNRVSWCTSFGVGSGELARRCLRSDPPSAAELEEAQAQITTAIEGLEVPRPVEAVAVGGSAASLRRLAGSVLDSEAFARSLRLLAAERASEIARRFALDVERVRLLPAGLLILRAASELFGAALSVGRGGLREAVLLEASDG